MQANALRAGVSHREFWSLCPSEFVDQVEAESWRWEQRRKLALVTAIYSNAPGEAVKALRDATRPSSPRRAQTPGEMVRIAAMYTKALGGRDLRRVVT